MFYRQDTGMTLGDAHTLLAERDANGDVRRVAPDKIGFHLDSADPTITLGTGRSAKVVPASEQALAAFGDLLQIPQAFLKRAGDKVQGETMNALLTDMTRNTLLKDAKVVLRHGGIEQVDEWGKDGIAPIQVVNTAISVLSPEAPIARWIDTPGFTGFDAYVPEGFAHGYGGEGVTNYADGNERDDITAGGLRFGLNTKQGLAPFVQKWLFRLACTNGMEVEQAGLKVDARGQSIDEVMAELESVAQAAFGQVERDIAAFYELKNTPVDNVERAIGTIARERELPDRSTMALIRLAASEDVPDLPTMFDVVNLVTNFANSPSITRDGGRLLLERAGGQVIGEHAARCGHCLQKVV